MYVKWGIAGDVQKSKGLDALSNYNNLNKSSGEFPTFLVPKP